MGNAGRPQGHLKGETEQADGLARFVREITAGVTVRELAQRYPVGRTSWSEYRSAGKDIPWHWLERLVRDHARDPHTRAALLDRGRTLHEQATRAAAGIQPRAQARSAAEEALDGARRAQRQAEEEAAGADRQIRALVATVAELRGQQREPAVTPPARGSRPAAGLRAVRTGAAVAAAGVLVLAGVLVGQQLDTGEPAPGADAPLAAACNGWSEQVWVWSGSTLRSLESGECLDPVAYTGTTSAGPPGT
ncbi:hypothetical protein OHV05_34105 [Kitasatospora sp. NBC_00070]|uniref:hypothetical protein n=1 Tax=Kitasatospora sp. NBC_00070 TaxID=2975962 RepID=UPI0032461011